MLSFGLMIVNNLKWQTPKSRQGREKELVFEKSFYCETQNMDRYCIKWRFTCKNFSKYERINETEPIPKGELGLTIESKIPAKVAKNCSFHFSLIQYIIHPTIYIPSGIGELTRVQSLYFYGATREFSIPQCRTYQCNIDLAGWKSIDVKVIQSVLEWKDYGFSRKTQQINDTAHKTCDIFRSVMP